MKEIIRLDKSFLQAYKDLTRITLEGLVHKDWFMPLSETGMDELFVENSKFVVYGCMIDGVLVASSLYDRTEEEFAVLAKEAGVSPDRGAELGLSMVLPAYRGQNLMLELDRILVEKAKEEGFAYLVATAHPDNIASNKSLRKLGMQYVSTIMREEKYKRNVYYLPL